MDESASKITPVFNELSRCDQRELKAAAIVSSLTADAARDIAKHPWRYPVYAIYMAIMMLPTPGIHTLVMSGLLIGWAKCGFTRGARELKEQLKRAVEPQTLADHYMDCIQKKEDGQPVVRNKLLLGKMLGEAKHDLVKATQYLRAKPNPS